FQMPSACGKKVEDVNGDGLAAGDPPPPTVWTICISGTVYGEACTQTDANGNWCIDSLGGGPHVVSEVAQTNWTQTCPPGGTYSFAGVSANVPGANKTGLNFCNFKNICISGVKYRDRNGNGVRDAGEEGIGGVQINVSGTIGSNCVKDPGAGTGSTVTAADGSWEICCVGPGNHVVTETAIPGFTQTQPPGPSFSYAISPATSGVNIAGLDFGNFQDNDATYKYRTFSSDDIEAAAQMKAAKLWKATAPTVPNLRNVVEDYFRQLKLDPVHFTPIIVGLPNNIKKGPPFLRITKAGDFLKSLWDKGVTHSDPDFFRGFDFFNGGIKPILGLQKSLSAKKQKNDLAEELIVLAFNLAASSSTPPKLPPGLGNIIYNDGLAEPPANFCAGFPLNGKTVAQIKAIGDNLMTNWGGVPPICYQRLEEVVSYINEAFSCGPQNLDGSNVDCEVANAPDINPADWQIHLKIFVRGAYSVVQFAYLRANPNAVPAVIPTPEPNVVVLPDHYTLYQNYPNPFNPTTSIDFDLPEAANVTLKICEQTVDFDASTLSSGVYIYRIVAEGLDDDGNVIGQTFTQTKKMVLMK
ncbi:MAG: hypothetical protein HY033_03325, partial [Ignavibacteriae bacterium]|nr:hypothetical protein [Ignavibacteriota bacterium]